MAEIGNKEITEQIHIGTEQLWDRTEQQKRATNTGTTHNHIQLQQTIKEQKQMNKYTANKCRTGENHNQLTNHKDSGQTRNRCGI